MHIVWVTGLSAELLEFRWCVCLEVVLDAIVNEEVPRVSAAPVGPGESSVGYHVTPTLVLFCGTTTDKDFYTIRDAVNARLGFNMDPKDRAAAGFSIPNRVLRWRRVGPTEKITARAVRRWLDEFTQMRFEQELIDQNVLLYQEEAQPIQMIFVHQKGDEDELAAQRVLCDLSSAIYQALPGRQCCKRLVVIGDLEMDWVKDSDFWPRFRMQAETEKDTTDRDVDRDLDRDWMLETWQNLILALTTSNVADVIDDKIRKMGEDSSTVKWIWIGSSALVAEAENMYQYIAHKVLARLIHTLLKEKLDESNQVLVKDWIREQVAVFVQSGLTRAQNIAATLNDPDPEWNTKPQVDLAKSVRLYNWLARRLARLGIRVQEKKAKEKILPLLMGGHRLKQNLMAARPPADLDGILLESLRRLRDVLIPGLHPRIVQMYGALLDLIATLTREGYLPLPTLIETEKGIFVQPSSVSLEQRRPHGLAAVIYAVSEAVAQLKRSPDLPADQGVAPYLSVRESFLGKIAKTVADDVVTANRYIGRSKRLFLSPQGLVLRLFPAWSLLTMVIIVLLQQDKQFAMFLAAAALAILGVAEYLIYWNSLDHLRVRLQARVQIDFGKAALGLVAKILCDYRILLAGRLQEIAATMNLFLTRLAALEFDSEQKVEVIRAQFDEWDWRQSTIYHVADAKHCDKIVDEIFKKTSTTLTDFVAEQVLGVSKPALDEAGQVDREERQEAFAKGPRAFNLILGELSRRGQELTDELFNWSELQVSAIVREKESFKKGQHGEHLDWLDRHAQPLGMFAGPTRSSFTIITYKDKADVAGAFGKTSGRWKSEWEEAISLQEYEIGCIRGVIERVEGV